mmetsp:Transcript_35565/g.34610  ORF Transcript_35565/g.34610 Transcript_35565/m.34610 type:complete len:213 (+) Transcript_35565:280-918(+)
MEITPESALTEDCFFEVNVKSEKGCPTQDFNLTWTFFSLHWFIFCPYLVVVGCYLLVMGVKPFIPTAMLFLTNALFLAFLFLFFTFSPDIALIEVGWVALVLALVIGIPLTMWLVDQNASILEFIVGGTGVVILWMMVYSIVFYRILGAHGTIAMVLIGVKLFTVIGALTIKFNKDILMTFSTSITGPYLIAKGVSMVVKDYPNEFTLNELY